MSGEVVDNQEKKKKKLLPMPHHSLAGASIKNKCEKCGQYYYKDEVHYCH